MEVVLWSGFLATADLGNLKQTCSQMSAVPIVNERALMRSCIQRAKERVNLHKERAAELEEDREHMRECFDALFDASDSSNVLEALGNRDIEGAIAALKEIDRRSLNILYERNMDEEPFGRWVPEQMED